MNYPHPPKEKVESDVISSVHLSVCAHNLKTIHLIWVLSLHKLKSNQGSVLKDGLDPDLDWGSRIVFVRLFGNICRQGLDASCL